ncbi:hypothetical protein [Ferirhizobium litorale]|uniref:Uncharacterized protein n=1 Tax=Ferirhizobium litorale TaxID=2927786 RepID=A0AAE3U4H7_9HYPH|nr:hypothetical protein [Fererhizobium litorale]MDI7923428.1 hypothetical protein [Fererhizobium litorale]
MTAPMRLLRPETELPFRFEVGQEVSFHEMRARIVDRLRSAMGREYYQVEVLGEAYGRPHRTVLADHIEPAARDVAMRAQVAVTLAERMYKNIKAMESLLGHPIADHIGFDEFEHQLHEVKQAADHLWSAA